MTAAASRRFAPLPPGTVRVKLEGQCEARTLAGNLYVLWDAGWEVEVFKMWPAADPLIPWRCRLRRERRHVRGFDGTGPRDALARAVEWSRQEGYVP